MEAEIQSHEPVINSVNSRSQQMIRSGHFASSDIEEKMKQLQTQLSQLKDTASVRRLRLLDAVESQMVRKKSAFIPELAFPYASFFRELAINNNYFFSSCVAKI